MKQRLICRWCRGAYDFGLPERCLDFEEQVEGYRRLPQNEANTLIERGGGKLLSHKLYIKESVYRVICELAVEWRTLPMGTQCDMPFEVWMRAAIKGLIS